MSKVEKMLATDDFSSADVKKMRGTGFYRAKLDDKHRLLFQLAQYGPEACILLLEVIANHDYAKSKFLRGADVDTRKIPEVNHTPEMVEEDAKATPLRYVNPAGKRFHLLDKVISLDADQEEIYRLPPPLIIIGSAGSGKTALTLEKMKTYPGRVAYVSLSSFLVENSRQLYSANGYENDGQEIDFLSFKDYLESIQVPAGKELDFRTFERWYRSYEQRFKFKDAYKIFEEFRGVLTGSVTHAAHLNRQEYLSLGVKQSVFPAEEREKLFELFELYLTWLENQDYYDPNLVAFAYLDKVEANYDFLVVDEVQDITNVQLLLLTKSLTNPGNFILSGDSNQIVHPNFFSWSKIKTLFFHQELHGSALRILKTNYRNSRAVTRLSNDLLRIKNLRFGSIDRESTFLINTVADNEGEINFYKYSDKIKRELNRRTEGSAKFAVLVMDKEQKARVAKDFKTPLVFTIQEAKGLEYENIILVNFLSDYDKTFREIAAGVTAADLQEDQLRYARPKDKTNKDQEVYKFYINSLYVAFTRAVKNLHLVETATKNELLQLLGVISTNEEVKLELVTSTDDEWLAEAHRLEQQGKTEQAAAIRARIAGQDYISADEAELLQERIFAAPAEADRKDLERLLIFATSRHLFSLVFRLATEAKYGPARHYYQEYEKAREDLFKYVRFNNVAKVKQLIDKYGIHLTTAKENLTGLMIAAQYCRSELLVYFLAQGARRGAQDNLGHTALQHLLLGADRSTVKNHELAAWYPKLSPTVARCQFQGRVYTINSKSMEFFLLNLLNALRLEVFNYSEPLANQCLLINDFLEVIEDMPPQLLPDYRRKRQYVSGILAKNEVDRDDRYNKKFLIRRSRGCYDVHPQALITWE